MPQTSILNIAKHRFCNIIIIINDINSDKYIGLI